MFVLNNSDLFWQVPLSDLKKGYTFDEGTAAFICLICETRFEKGIIYADGQNFYEAEKFAVMHITREHGSMFDYLLGLNKKLTGLSDLQKNLLQLFYDGYSDNEIVSKLDGGSTSTIRNHRFALREKEKQARLFLAIMDLLEQKNSSVKSSVRSAKQQLVPAHRTATMRDERYAITEQEYQETVLKYFKEGLDGPLDTFPTKEKRKIVVLRHLISRFATGKRYTEKEVNAVLQKDFHDFVTLRRYMIEYGFMDREPDGSAYWVKEGIPMMSKEKKKELQLAYTAVKRPMGVFGIRNKETGKVLVGSSRNLGAIWNRHHFQLNMGVHPNKELQNDWKQLGEQAFIFEILETLKERDEGYQDIRRELELLEEKWVKEQSYGNHIY
jgi:hypothetical protein